MKKLTYVNLAIGFFFLVVALDSLGIILKEQSLRYLFKPMISPMLALAYLISVKKINKLYLVALIFSFLADILLLNKSDLFFMMGLMSFLAVHLAYIAIVLKNINSIKGKDLIMAPIPFVLVLVFVIFFIYQNLREFMVPIIIYGLVVSIFGSLTFYNYLQKRTITSLLLFFGSFFFIISNAMSAVEKFRLENRELAVLIMLTYICAQYLIYLYMVRKSKIT